MHKPEQAQTPDVFVYISAESTQITTEFLSQYRREKRVTLSTKTRNEGSGKVFLLELLLFHDCKKIAQPCGFENVDNSAAEIEKNQVDASGHRGIQKFHQNADSGRIDKLDSLAIDANHFRILVELLLPDAFGVLDALDIELSFY